MIEALMGRKLGMTQIFDETGRAVPVTVLKVGPCVVTQVRTQERDGYEAVQLGFEESKRLNSPERGHQKAAGSSMRYLREVQADDVSTYEVGQVVDCSVFTPGAKVDVTATSKGKGFAGVMKRHGFSGVGASHGAHKNHRKPGSIGGASTPSRVFKGLKMAGRMGAVRHTTLNLTVHAVDVEKSLLLIKGAVPGARGQVVLVRSAVKGA